jgi:predicted dehydrogenase
MLRVGIIGAGDFGAQHARAISQLEGVRLVAASRTNAAALADFTRSYGGRAFTDYRELLAQGDVDAVVIATPHHLHTTVVQAAAEAGKHILLEKPMAPSLSECDAMLEVVEAAGVRLMVGHTSHFVPAYQRAKELLDSGELGEVIYAHSTMIRPWMTSNRRDWHLDRTTGGGMWLTIGVHVIDQLRWLAAAPVASVTAELQTRFHRQEADDFGVALLRFRNRVTATAVCVGYRTGVFSFLTDVTCSEGLLKIDHAKGTFIGRGETWQEVPGSVAEDWMLQGLVREWRAFAGALASGEPMPVTGAYARHVMEVAFAAEASSREKREIAIP